MDTIPYLVGHCTNGQSLNPPLRGDDEGAGGGGGGEVVNCRRGTESCRFVDRRHRVWLAFRLCIHRDRHNPLDLLALIHIYTLSQQTRPDLRGRGGKLGSCPGASTTKGPPQKNSKKLLLKGT